jgi:hypothetical protein
MTTPDGEPDIVMMTAKDYFYTENEGFAKICVMRVGDSREALTVSYETVKDKNVMAGGSSDFKSISGKLTFKYAIPVFCVGFPFLSPSSPSIPSSSSFLCVCACWRMRVK